MTSNTFLQYPHPISMTNTGKSNLLVSRSGIKKNLIQPKNKYQEKNLIRSTTHSSSLEASNHSQDTTKLANIVPIRSDWKDIKFYVLSSTCNSSISNLKAQFKQKYSSNFEYIDVLVLKQQDDILQVCSALELSQWDICGFTQENIDIAISDVQNSLQIRGLRIGDYIKGLVNGCNLHKFVDIKTLSWLCCCTVVYASDESARASATKYGLDPSRAYFGLSSLNKNDSTACRKMNESESVLYLNSSASDIQLNSDIVSDFDMDSTAPSYMSEHDPKDFLKGLSPSLLSVTKMVSQFLSSDIDKELHSLVTEYMNVIRQFWKEFVEKRDNTISSQNNRPLLGKFNRMFVNLDKPIADSSGPASELDVVPQRTNHMAYRAIKASILLVFLKVRGALLVTGQKFEGIIPGILTSYYLSYVLKCPQAGSPTVIGHWKAIIYIPLCLGVLSVMLLKCVKGREKQGHILAGSAAFSLMLLILSHISIQLPVPYRICFYSIIGFLVV